MQRRIGHKRREALIEDLIRSERDALAIGKEYGLSADDMADWVSQPKNARSLRGLCHLADTQTQMLMSRYRLLTATRLIAIATTPGEAKEDVARRACVDVLKLELKGAIAEAPPPQLVDLENGEDDLLAILNQAQKTTWPRGEEEAFDGDA